MQSTVYFNDRCDRVKIEGVDRHVFVRHGQVFDTRWIFSVRHFAAKVVTAGRDVIERKITEDEWMVIAKECATAIGKVTLEHAGMPYHVDEVRNGDS